MSRHVIIGRQLHPTLKRSEQIRSSLLVQELLTSIPFTGLMTIILESMLLCSRGSQGLP